jgi:hypothetical protein
VTFQQEESEVGLPGGNGQLITLGLGLLATALAAAYVTRLAKVMPLVYTIFFFTTSYVCGSCPDCLFPYAVNISEGD